MAIFLCQNSGPVRPAPGGSHRRPIQCALTSRHFDNAGDTMMFDVAPRKYSGVRVMVPAAAGLTRKSLSMTFATSPQGLVRFSRTMAVGFTAWCRWPLSATISPCSPLNAGASPKPSRGHNGTGGWWSSGGLVGIVVWGASDPICLPCSVDMSAGHQRSFAGPGVSSAKVGKMPLSISVLRHQPVPTRGMRNFGRISLSSLACISRCLVISVGQTA